MLDVELTAKRREKQSGGSVHLGEVEVEGYYQGATRGRGSSRGRGRAGGRIGGRVSEVAHNNCFRCGQADHSARDCPKKNDTCTYYGAVGHIEHTCYDKDKGVPRGGKAAGSSARGGRGGVVGC